jgi:hypothetical protein
MKNIRLALKATAMVAVAATSMINSASAQRVKGPISSEVRVGVPVWVKNLIPKNITAMSTINLTAQCDVIQIGKGPPGWKPPMANYRTGGVAFQMSGIAPSTISVILDATTIPWNPNVSQPLKSQTFAAGKFTAGVDVATQGLPIVLHLEDTTGNYSMIPVTGVTPILDGNGGPSGYYKWNGALSCPKGEI